MKKTTIIPEPPTPAEIAKLEAKYGPLARTLPKHTKADHDRIVRETAERDQVEPRAKSARYNASKRELVLTLTNGVTMSIPTDLVQGLVGQRPQHIAAVEIEGNGYLLHWEELDQDFTVPGLVSGIFGTRQWMDRLPRLGGLSKSPAKAAAARANGRKGGRPKVAAGVTSKNVKAATVKTAPREKLAA